MKIDDVVIFKGCFDGQLMWGHEDPIGVMALGEEGIVTDVEVHTWYTTIWVNGEGPFNSVCFEEV